MRVDQLSGVEIVKTISRSVSAWGSNLIGSEPQEDLGRLRRILFDVQS